MHSTTAPHVTGILREVVWLFAAIALEEARIGHELTANEVDRLVFDKGIFAALREHRDALTPEFVASRVVDRMVVVPKTENRLPSLSFTATERLARLFMSGGNWKGRRVLPQQFVDRVTKAQRNFVWEPIGEGREAIITRQLYDSWRAAPSISRAELKAVEPLIDVSMSPDDLAEALQKILGRQHERFTIEIAAANRPLFEQRWRTVLGFGALTAHEGVVVLEVNDIVAVYTSARAGELHALLPFLRAL